MRIFQSMAISASGLTAERLRMDIISSNIANINTTRTEEGGPYRRKLPVFAEKLDKSIQSGNNRFRGRGVKVVEIAEDQSPPRLVYDPGHPDANEEGYVAMPNINIITEMVDMITATRAYEANVTALNAAKSMALKALEIGRG
ncbi:flagellar basal body rod protein FlgC [Calderihabitans maritimus]|uniref:Flagellar basal-body rod protein FlgC n=1 Tax=Calderihabitans maritimus TaxID=1246530 RepID=A0A1Z5HTR1_9FIRM|nr:flagellar basal body rod protein FlgC [Calderihabitans maritimus]GAW92914.1 flagellar basal-body rod protein FlgC [Calderihabitans maritimus]